MPSFWPYTRDWESDKHSTPWDINQETGTPVSREDVSDDKEEDIAEAFNSTPEKDA